MGCRWLLCLLLEPFPSYWDVRVCVWSYWALYPIWYSCQVCSFHMRERSGRRWGDGSRVEGKADWNLEKYKEVSLCWKWIVWKKNKQNFKRYEIGSNIFWIDKIIIDTFWWILKRQWVLFKLSSLQVSLEMEGFIIGFLHDLLFLWLIVCFPYHYFFRNLK